MCNKNRFGGKTIYYRIKFTSLDWRFDFECHSLWCDRCRYKFVCYTTKDPFINTDIVIENTGAYHDNINCFLREFLVEEKSAV